MRDERLQQPAGDPEAAFGGLVGSVAVPMTMGAPSMRAGSSVRRRMAGASTLTRIRFSKDSSSPPGPLSPSVLAIVQRWVSRA